MESKRNFTKSLSTLLASAAILVSSNSALASNSTQEDVERVAVIAKTPLFLLKTEIKKETQSFYKAFNQLNTISKFEIVCRKETPTGSNLPKRICEPRYVSLARARLTSAGSLGPMLNLTRIPTANEIKLATKADREASIANMEKIINGNEELKAQYILLQAKVKNYNERHKAREW